MLKKIIISTVAVLAFGQSVSADDYHLYGTWTPGNLTNYFGITGFVDKQGLISGGEKGDEYIFFTAGPGGDWSSKGYIYRVKTNGDANAHPDVNGQNIADRIFTYVSEHELSNGRGHAGEFYVDDTGIYYGSGNNIKRWNFDWSNETTIVPNGLYSETLAKNITTNEWWTATRYQRKVYKYSNSTNQWEYQFTYPSLAGDHHDGMEIVNNTLYLSDMTSDKIIAYKLNPVTGVVDDPNDYNISTYSASPYVEGMGYGPNQHFWMGGGYKLYEIGAGTLTTSCSQTFNYTTNWQMQRSKCDNIKVPGFDDTIMAKKVGDKLVFATADAGAKAWLEGLPNCDITVVDSLTLSTGEGFWTVAKSNISKTVTTGKSKNKYVSFQNGAYTFVGFDVPVDLNSKFGIQPVEAVYYYDGTWHTWEPADGSQMVTAGQGLYVLANGDFSLLVK